MVYSEYEKIHNAGNWERQLGSSGSGIIGAIATGELAGSAVGFGLGALELNPITIAAGTFAGGAVGGAIGYKAFSGAYDKLYDIIYETP